MRVEFALIAAILIFCCWCAYILFNINSNVTATSTTSFPTMNSYDSPSTSHDPSRSQANQIYNKYHQSAGSEQPRQYWQFSSSEKPFWESVLDSAQDEPNNRVSLSRYFRHPEARQNGFPSNNSSSSNINNSLPNVYRQVGKDYYSSVPTSLVGYYRRPRPSNGVAHKEVSGGSLRVPDERNLASDSDSDSDSDAKLELEPESESDDQSESEQVPESEQERDDKQGGIEEVEHSLGSRFDTGSDEAEPHESRNENEQQREPAQEEQIDRRSLLNQVETKNKSSEIGEKVNHLPSLYEQSERSQIIRQREDLSLDGRGRGLISNKKSAANVEQPPSRKQKDHTSNTVMRLENEVDNYNTSEGSIENIGKLRANVTGSNDAEPESQRENLSERKSTARLRHPVGRKVGVPKSNGMLKKDLRKHKVKESLIAQHWDDDTSSPPERRTQKPEYQAELDANGEEVEAETATERPLNEEGEDDRDTGTVPEENEEDAKEEIEAEAETGPQQVGPKTGELDLIVDPEQFMHSSDRKKRDIFSTDPNDTVILISKLSANKSLNSQPSTKKHRLENEEFSSIMNEITTQFKNGSRLNTTNQEKILPSLSKTEYSFFNEGMPSQAIEKWKHPVFNLVKNASLPDGITQFDANQYDGQPRMERKFDVFNDNLIGSPNESYQPPLVEPLPSTVVRDNDHVVLPMSPYIHLDSYTLKQPTSSESKSKKKKVSDKKKKRKTKSRLIKSKSRAAELMGMKKKSKSSKDTNYKKDIKATKKLAKRHKQFTGSKAGFNKAKGDKEAGANKGAIYYKDKGYKKRGFKKRYEKLESGEQKSYFDEFRDKDHNKRWKGFDDRHNYSRKKSWNGKEGKKYRNFSSNELRDKKAGRWKNSSMSKMRKAHEKKSSKSSTKRKKRVKKKKKKVKRQQSTKKLAA